MTAARLWDALRRFVTFLLTDPSPRPFARLDVLTTAGERLRLQLCDSADGAERMASVLLRGPDGFDFERRLTRADVGEFSSGLKRCVSLADDLARRRRKPVRWGWRSFRRSLREVIQPWRDLRVLLAFASASTSEGALGAVFGVRGDDAAPAFYLSFLDPNDASLALVRIRLEDLPKIERFMTQAVFKLAPPRA
jgi:hypothetical protein